jgi:hypothetical protein
MSNHETLRLQVFSVPVRPTGSVHQRPAHDRDDRLVQRVLDGMSRDQGYEYVSNVCRSDRKPLPFQQRLQFGAFKILLPNRERATIGESPMLEPVALSVRLSRLTPHTVHDRQLRIGSQDRT